jgi:hypothetical protein
MICEWQIGKDVDGSHYDQFESAVLAFWGGFIKTEKLQNNQPLGWGLNPRHLEYEAAVPTNVQWDWKMIISSK